VQVGPIKPTLKALGTKRLKLECDEQLSIFGFNFHLRRYTMGSLLPHHFPVPDPRAPPSGPARPTKFAVYYEHHGDSMIRRVGLTAQ